MTYTTIHTIKYIIGALLLFTAFFLTTEYTHAYFTTGQRAEVLEGRTGIFLIDYSFGVKKHAVHIPAGASNGGAIRNTAVSYAIVDTDGKEVSGKNVGIVFSSAPLNKDGMYVIPKGVSKKMTLTVLFTPDEGTISRDYRLQVKHLPFNFDGKQQLQLNPSELKYYTTGYLSL